MRYGQWGRKSLELERLPAKTAMRCAALVRSFRLTVSFGECMYRVGIETNPVAVPAPLEIIESASVPLRFPVACRV